MSLICNDLADARIICNDAVNTTLTILSSSTDRNRVADVSLTCNDLADARIICNDAVNASNDTDDIVVMHLMPATVLRMCLSFAMISPMRVSFAMMLSMHLTTLTILS